MKAPRGIAALRSLRNQPLWRLLVGDKAPVVIAVLETLLLDGEKVLASSVLLERLSNMLEELRGLGEELPQTAQAYVADWLAHGYLTRRLPAGASEEQLELSSDAAHAIRFVTSLRERRAFATESRLATVMRQLLKLAEETDPNPQTRVLALLAERDRIDREIESVRAGGAKALSSERAVERAREVIALAGELAADFRRVRDDFADLNKSLRQSLLENEGSRGDVLESLFAGIDLIGESDAGKTFSAFWRLLTDPQQAETLRESLDAVSKRPFLKTLELRERKFLLHLTTLLTDEGSDVHDVLQSFARSLKSFVESREFLEQRRLHSLLKQATQAALAARACVRPTSEIDYALTLTSSRVRSASQSALYDPAERITEVDMRDADGAEVTLELVSVLVRQSEIDLRTLRRNVRAMLEQRPRVSIAELLARFPAEQGLGSVVGYVALGVKHGQVTNELEQVSWSGRDHIERRAKVRAIHFVRERYDELVD